jgi:hypothetical protein
MTPLELAASIEDKLRVFGADFAGLNLRGKVLRLVEILATTRKLNIAVVRASGCDAGDARERIRLYLIQHVGITLDAKELEVVSGISEYGRRIRELRVQDGYRVLSGKSNDPESGLTLKPTEYVLIRAEPDLLAARRWHIANRIRRDKSGGAKQRILIYLKENVNQVVTSEELAYVARNAKEFGRRTRELRTEEGYYVATRFTGRPDLRSGEYVLESLERIAEPHDRHIPAEIQEEVYARDHNTCRSCDWNREKWSRDDPRFLELHHIQEHANRGANIAANLLVLCNVCHDKVHAGRLNLDQIMRRT